MKMSMHLQFSLHINTFSVFVFWVSYKLKLILVFAYLSCLLLRKYNSLLVSHYHLQAEEPSPLELCTLGSTEVASKSFLLTRTEYSTSTSYFHVFTNLPFLGIKHSKHNLQTCFWFQELLRVRWLQISWCQISSIHFLGERSHESKHPTMTK